MSHNIDTKRGYIMSNIIDTLEERYGDITPLAENCFNHNISSLPRDMKVGEMLDLMGENKALFAHWMNENMPEEKEKIFNYLDSHSLISISSVQRDCAMGFNKANLLLKQLRKYKLISDYYVDSRNHEIFKNA